MKLTTAILASVLLLGGTSTLLVAAEAGAPAPKAAVKHPRRHQVNKRIKKQEARIDAKEKAGKMSPEEADKLKKHDQEIKGEEKDMAAQDGGHITKQDQATLNQQLNQNSQEIKNH